jgi:hypothetical protein
VNEIDMYPLLKHLLKYLREKCRPLPWLTDMADKNRRNIRLTLHTDKNGRHVWIEIKVYKKRKDIYVHLATDDPDKRTLLVNLSNAMERNCGISVLDLRQPNRSGWTRVGYLIRQYDKTDRFFDLICQCLKKLDKYYQTLNLR